LNTISGIIPLSLNGISSAEYNCERIPFCPDLEANLSPTIGFL